MDISSVAEKVEGLIRQGFDRKTISKKVSGFSDELFSIAKARIKNGREGKINPSFLFDEEDLRFCTNQMIAAYRAERLACGMIVDVGSGIGVQAIEFAKKCGKVVAVEIDVRRIGYSKFNASVENVSNIDFVNEDALKALDGVKKADVVFWDPERPPSEVERALESLKPGFKEFFSKAKDITSGIVVELPPQIDRKKIRGIASLSTSLLIAS